MAIFNSYVKLPEGILMDICMVLDFIHPVLLFKASFITIFDGLVGHLHDILDHVRKVWAYPHEISQSIQLYI